MAINRLAQSSVQSGLPKFDSVWDGRSAVGSMEAISSVTAPSGGITTFNFTNIPQTYSHLQLRVYAANAAQADFSLRFNNDTAGNYRYHNLYGNGSTVTAYDYGNSSPEIKIAFPNEGTNSATSFATLIIDILDYTNTSKNKTVKTLSGLDRNGSGQVGIQSGVWMSTSAITSILFATNGLGTMVQYSTFSLYGIK